MQITPLNGIALKTIFKFSTGAAADEPSDYPLKYTFQYEADGIIIKMGEFYENMVISSQLPYSSKKQNKT